MSSAPGRSRWTITQWLIVILASIGFAFDIYELLMMPLILRPALLELTGFTPGTADYAAWAGRLFYIPAFAGGLFGLVGGYLTDRLGRRRVLTWSILLYAFSAFAAGFSTSIEMLLFFRCTTFVGVCVEFVAAVAWLAELFQDPHERERVLGYTQAFSSFGGLLVAGVNGLLVAWALNLPSIELPSFLAGLGEIKEPHAAWRYTLMSGLIPAIPLIIIRPFLPESPVWQQKRLSGTLKRPSIGQLFAPDLRRTTIVTTILFACGYGAAFGAIQQIPQIVPGLPEVQNKVVQAKTNTPDIKARLEAAATQAEKDQIIESVRAQIAENTRNRVRDPQKAGIEQGVASDVTKVQEIGGLVGRFLLAFLVVRFASRQKLLRTFQVPGLFLMPIVFGLAAVHSLTWLYAGIFFAGLVTIAQFSFWGNYLPLVYPVHLRGTGESFAANIGGRLIGTSFAWVTNTLAVQEFMPGASAPAKMAYAAAIVGTTVYLVGLVASFWLPEPNKETLSE